MAREQLRSRDLPTLQELKRPRPIGGSIEQAPRVEPCWPEEVIWDEASTRLGRLAALGRSYLDALEVPRREATRVQVVAADLRPPFGPTLEYELELHFTARHEVATCRTRLSHAQAAEHAARSGRWRSAVQYRFAGFLSQDWLVERSGASHFSARRSGPDPLAGAGSQLDEGI